MLNIHNSLITDSLYITNKDLLKYCDDNKISVRASTPRRDLLREIDSFIGNDRNKYKTFSNHIEECLKYGKVDIYIKKMENMNENMIRSKLNSIENKILLDAKFDRKYELINFKEIKTDKEDKIELIYTKKLERITKEKSNESGRADLLYVIFVELDFKNKFLLSFSNPHENLINSNGESTSVTKENKNLLDKVKKDFSLKEKRNYYDNMDKDDNFYGKAIYNVLEKHIVRSKEIEYEIDELNKKLYIKENIEKLFKNLEPNRFNEDLDILLEKYLCIEGNDTIINKFISGRKDYVIKIFKKNYEDSTVDTRSGSKAILYNPSKDSILIKSSFYDNKKSLIDEKTCEEIIIIYEFNGEPLNVKYEKCTEYIFMKFYKTISSKDIIENKILEFKNKINDSINRI